MRSTLKSIGLGIVGFLFAAVLWFEVIPDVIALHKVAHAVRIQEAMQAHKPAEQPK